MSETFSAITRFLGETFTPFFSIILISSKSAQGFNTTPLPITANFPGLIIPEGNRDNLMVSLPMTRVWPALCPPWNLTIISALSLRTSMIFPFPSSPHWAPITARFGINFFLSVSKSFSTEVDITNFLYPLVKLKIKA